MLDFSLSGHVHFIYHNLVKPVNKVWICTQLKYLLDLSRDGRQCSGWMEYHDFRGGHAVKSPDQPQQSNIGNGSHFKYENCRRIFTLGRF